MGIRKYSDFFKRIVEAKLLNKLLYTNIFTNYLEMVEFIISSQSGSLKTSCSKKTLFLKINETESCFFEKIEKN